MTSLLSVDGLSWSFGAIPVLRDISFTVATGEKVIVLGPNGAGKSTLFSLICGLHATPELRIRIRGAAAGSGDALRSMGVVFQMQTLDLDLSVDQNLRYAAALHGMTAAEATARIEDVTASTDLADRRADKLRALNGGHRRRVEIARAMLHRPDLLLLDEPTAGLDIPMRRTLVEELHRHPGAVLWATHLIDEVADGDRVLVLHRGHIVADGQPEALMRRTGTATLSRAFDVLTGAEP